MYLGRIVAIAMNKEGNVSALYRVSSGYVPIGKPCGRTTLFQ